MDSFKYWSVLLTVIDEDDDVDDDDCVLLTRLAASLNRSHSTKSIMARAKESARSSVRDTVRCWMNSAEKVSRMLALSVT